MALATLVAIGAVGALLWEAVGGSSAKGTAGPKGPVPTPKKPPAGIPGVTAPIPPAGDKKPKAPQPAAHDPRIDDGMPAALAAVTISLLDNPNATADQLNAAANAAELAGFPIAAASLRLRAEELAPVPGISPEENPPPEPAPGTGGGLIAPDAPGPDATPEELAAAAALEQQLGQMVASGSGSTEDQPAQGGGGFGGAGGAGGAPSGAGGASTSDLASQLGDFLGL